MAAVGQLPSLLVCGLVLPVLGLRPQVVSEVLKFPWAPGGAPPPPAEALEELLLVDFLSQERAFRMKNWVPAFLEDKFRLLGLLQAVFQELG